MPRVVRKSSVAEITEDSFHSSLHHNNMKGALQPMVKILANVKCTPSFVETEGGGGVGIQQGQKMMILGGGKGRGEYLYHYHIIEFIKSVKNVNFIMINVMRYQLEIKFGVRKRTV